MRGVNRSSEFYLSPKKNRIRPRNRWHLIKLRKTKRISDSEGKLLGGQFKALQKTPELLLDHELEELRAVELFLMCRAT